MSKMLVDLLKMSKILVDFLSFIEKYVEFFCIKSKSNCNLYGSKNSSFVSPALFKLSWIPLKNDEISINYLQINITA